MKQASLFDIRTEFPEIVAAERPPLSANGYHQTAIVTGPQFEEGDVLPLNGFPSLSQNDFNNFHKLMPDLYRSLSRISGFLDDIIIAENEIERAIKLNPGRAMDLWDSFMFLKPPFEMGERKILYCSYYRELLTRIAKREDTRPATEAELLFAICDASLVSSLTNAGSCIYWELFNRCLPEEMAKLTEKFDNETSRWRPREEWNNQTEDEILRMQRKFRVESRRWDNYIEDYRARDHYNSAPRRLSEMLKGTVQ